ncbi:MAG: hypothetical protein IIZ35_02245, partial [Clostridia bacterium]|nr:hypothetical protein [Clostridia bacterium]
MNGVIRERIELLARTCAPFFGHDGPYFIGSGTVGASGNPDGEWSFAVGPDLTGPDFLESETIRLSGFGKLPFEMRRLRGRGAFFGIAFEAGVYRASLTEVTPPDALSILRYLTLENESAEERVFTLEVRIRPGDQTRAVAKDGLEIIAPEGCWCFGNHETKNWAERRMRVFMPGASCEEEGGSFVLRLTLDLHAGSGAEVPIWHEFAYGDAYPAKEDPESFLKRGFSEWEKWLA